MSKECKCGHEQYSHGGVNFTGRCTIWDCKCKKFKEQEQAVKDVR
jgi:hypothetical protein